MNEPPKITGADLLRYVAGRLDLIEAKVDNLDKKGDARHTVSTRIDIAHFAWSFLRWGGVVSTQISTVFIASYVAFEHSWYLAKVTAWITKLLSWHW